MKKQNRSWVYSSPASLISGVLGLVLNSTLFGAELARWEAATPAKAHGIQLARPADSDWHIEKAGAGKVARLKPSSDLYTRAAYQFTLTAPPSGKAWLIVEFLDRDYGLLTLTPGVPETRQWGIARVNTGRIRRAVFQYDPAPAKSLRIEGLDYLRAVILTDEAPAVEQTPLVEPALKFARYSERVTTAASDSAASR